MRARIEDMLLVILLVLVLFLPSCASAKIMHCEGGYLYKKTASGIKPVYNEEREPVVCSEEIDHGRV